MWQRLSELLNAARDRRILLVGDFLLDRYLYRDAERISPEAPAPVQRVARQHDALGRAGSVAADIRAIMHSILNGLSPGDERAETPRWAVWSHDRGKAAKPRAGDSPPNGART